MIFTDASGYATGAAIIQLTEGSSTAQKIQDIIQDIRLSKGIVSLKILGFTSLQLMTADTNYNVYDLELLTIDKV